MPSPSEPSHFSDRAIANPWIEMSQISSALHPDKFHQCATSNDPSVRSVPYWISGTVPWQTSLPYPPFSSDSGNLATHQVVSLCLTFDRTGTILAINSAVATHLGYIVADLVGCAVQELLHPQSWDWLQEQIPQISEELAEELAIASELNIAGCGSESDLLSLDLAENPAPATLSPEKRHTLKLRCADETFVPVKAKLRLLTTGTAPIFLLDCQSVGFPLDDLEEILQRWQESERIRDALSRLRASLARDLRQSLDLKPVLQTIVREVRQILNADRVLIYRMGAAETGRVWMEAIAPHYTGILGRSLPANLFPAHRQQAYTNRYIQTLSDISVSTRLPLEALQDTQVRALMVAPVLLQENLWGLLIIHQCQPRPWQDWEQELLSQIAAQLEVAVQQSELSQQVQRLNADLERQIQARTAELQVAKDFEATLKRITDKVRDCVDEDQILQAAVQELATTLGMGACNAALYDLDKGISTIRYEFVTSLAPSQGRIASLNTFPEIYQPLLQGQCVQFCSVTPSPVRGRVAMLAAPIFDDQGVLGDLWLIDQEYHGFSEQDIRLVQQVANQCAIALRQARLFQAAQTEVQQLEKLNRLKDDFLSTVSHELRTPMSNIKMATQMLGMVLQQTGILTAEPNRAGRYFKILQEECQREIKLINDLLDLSRLDAGTEVLSISRFDLSTWLESILPAFEERTQSHEQELELDFAPNLPAIATDPTKLERILIELLTNACKYTPRGERITISAQVEARMKDEGGRMKDEDGRMKDERMKDENERMKDENERMKDEGKRMKDEDERVNQASVTSDTQEESLSSHPTGTAKPNIPHPSSFLKLRVTNSGVEIPPEERSRIFEAFYRIPNNDPWQYGGTGLGLALVKKLTEYLGGTLQAESDAGITQFIVTLPMHPTAGSN